MDGFWNPIDSSRIVDFEWNGICIAFDQGAIDTKQTMAKQLWGKLTVATAVQRILQIGFVLIDEGAKNQTSANVINIGSSLSSRDLTSMTISLMAGQNRSFLA